MVYAYNFWYNVIFNFQLKVKLALDFGYWGFSTNKNDIKIALYSSVCNTRNDELSKLSGGSFKGFFLVGLLTYINSLISQDTKQKWNVTYVLKQEKALKSCGTDS